MCWPQPDQVGLLQLEQVTRAHMGCSLRLWVFLIDGGEMRGGSAAEEPREESAAFGLRRVDFALGVFAVAPVRCGHSGFHHGDVLAATGPGGFVTDAAGDCSAHGDPLLQLNIPQGVFLLWVYNTTGGMLVVKSFFEKGSATWQTSFHR